MNILALDLGTATGWALYRDGVVTSGTQVLATDKELAAQKKAGLARCCDFRASRLAALIDSKHPLDWVAFEDVQFMKGRAQAQLWGGFRAVVTMLYPAIKIQAVTVVELKMFACNHGNATKEMMIAAVPERLRKPEMDDNEADAIHLLRFTLKKLGAALI